MQSSKSFFSFFTNTISSVTNFLFIWFFCDDLMFLFILKVTVILYASPFAAKQQLFINVVIVRSRSLLFAEKWSEKWSHTILWLINDRSLMFSTNYSLLILKPLSKIILQTFHKLKQSALPCIKLPIKLSKRSLSLSNEMNFSLPVSTTELVNSRYSCSASATQRILTHINFG